MWGLGKLHVWWERLWKHSFQSWDSPGWTISHDPHLYPGTWHQCPGYEPIFKQIHIKQDQGNLLYPHIWKVNYHSAKTLGGSTLGSGQHSYSHVYLRSARNKLKFRTREFKQGTLCISESSGRSAASRLRGRTFPSLAKAAIAHGVAIYHSRSKRRSRSL